VLEIGDVLVDECGRQVWNVFVGANFGRPFSGVEPVGGGWGAAQRLSGLAIGSHVIRCGGVMADTLLVS
jgi:hypothetical protein